MCKCGCGKQTPIAKRNRRELGHIKGQHISYINGHNRKGHRGSDRWHEEDFGFDTPCWIWNGYINPHTGYGTATSWEETNKMEPAHRAIYKEFIGPIPEGLDIDHLCEIRNCVNPNHLEPVTRLENLIRSSNIKFKNLRRERENYERI